MAYKQELWDEAKKKCRLGDEEIRMAKEMGLNPKSLIKNIPNKKEMWKAPVKWCATRQVDILNIERFLAFAAQYWAAFLCC